MLSIEFDTVVQSHTPIFGLVVLSLFFTGQIILCLCFFFCVFVTGLNMWDLHNKVEFVPHSADLYSLPHSSQESLKKKNWIVRWREQGAILPWKAWPDLLQIILCTITHKTHLISIKYFYQLFFTFSNHVYIHIFCSGYSQ